MWPWGEQLYRTRFYNWKGNNEYPSQAVKRLMRELGSFFVEAWHAYLRHHKKPSNDPCLNYEADCLAFLSLVEEHNFDVRVAMKRARIQVDWHKAASKLNLSNNAGTRYSQR